MRTSWRGPGRIAVFVFFAATIAAATTTELPVSSATPPAQLAKSLVSKNATEAAAAAYWLGLKGQDAVPEIPRLVAALGDSRSVHPWDYRHDIARTARSTPGEEAASALARIGKPAVDPLIATLRTSTSSFARQNAAWALGQIDNLEHAPTSASVSRPKAK